mmetsp:Transcript_9611/g.34136  ORF Transcript_9611/g.34136 Transcript_9611/m.34136 type:complete len:213 (-) Transcript_9611:4719-5357(-)
MFILARPSTENRHAAPWLAPRRRRPRRPHPRPDPALRQRARQPERLRGKRRRRPGGAWRARAARAAAKRPDLAAHGDSTASPPAAPAQRLGSLPLRCRRRGDFGSPATSATVRRLPPPPPQRAPRPRTDTATRRRRRPMPGGASRSRRGGRARRASRPSTRIPDPGRPTTRHGPRATSERPVWTPAEAPPAMGTRTVRGTRAKGPATTTSEV